MTGTIRYWIQETRGAEVHSGGIPFNIPHLNAEVMELVHIEAYALVLTRFSEFKQDKLAWRSVATLDHEETPHE